MPATGFTLTPIIANYCLSQRKGVVLIHRQIRFAAGLFGRSFTRLLFACTLISGCATQVQTAPPIPKVFPLSVDFGSYCCGADPKAIEAMKKVVAQEEGNLRKPLEVWEFVAGREGERQYCFPLRELDDLRQIRFIRGMRRALIEFESARVRECVTCRGWSVSNQTNKSTQESSGSVLAPLGNAIRETSADPCAPGLPPPILPE